jgi:hypothetical protein
MVKCFGWDTSVIISALLQLFVIILIGIGLLIMLVPYNTGLTGRWQFQDKVVWLSRTDYGNYTIHDTINNMDHIGTLRVDRMLNPDKYTVVDFDGCTASRVCVMSRNSKTEIIDDVTNVGLLIQV